jgi:hypothetical protein
MQWLKIYFFKFLCLIEYSLTNIYVIYSEAGGSSLSIAYDYRLGDRG